MKLLSALFRAAFPADYAAAWFLFQHTTALRKQTTLSPWGR